MSISTGRKSQHRREEQPSEYDDVDERLDSERALQEIEPGLYRVTGVRIDPLTGLYRTRKKAEDA